MAIAEVFDPNEESQVALVVGSQKLDLEEDPASSTNQQQFNFKDDQVFMDDLPIGFASKETNL